SAFFVVCETRSTNIKMVITSPICQNKWINDLTTSTAPPSIKSTDKIIILLCGHPPFTLRTFHFFPPGFSRLMYNIFAINQRTQKTDFHALPLLIHVLCQKHYKNTLPLEPNIKATQLQRVTQKVLEKRRAEKAEENLQLFRNEKKNQHRQFNDGNSGDDD
ncbi:MAG: hypothetical protein KAT62_07430, partial [Desulfuromonadales bacterium]|nr:hypothetical protein [Desulfuromonadales bacterium]